MYIYKYIYPVFISPCVAVCYPSYHLADHQLILVKARPSNSPDTAVAFRDLVTLAREGSGDNR